MKLVILDRDGVINQESDEYIKTPDEWIPIPGSIEAIATLYQSGFRIVVASNQSGLGRGLFNIETLNQIHSKMHTLVGQAGGKIDAIFFCPHSPTDNCSCRKPNPGLLLEITKRLQVDMTTVHFIGDSFKDIQAGLAVNCLPILVMTGRGKQTLAQHLHDLENIPVYENLASAARALIDKKN